jgi:DNA-binding response OmpR family regulator
LAIVIKRYELDLQRVLIIDRQPSVGRLLSEILRDLGARAVLTESTFETAAKTLASLQPQLILADVLEDAWGGLDFVRTLRRSDLACRHVPLVVITANATEDNVLAARDAGVHEVLKKPFAIRDIRRRVEAVFGRPRDWIEGMEYIGPDRRRFNSGDYRGLMKRESDTPDTVESRIEEAIRILKTAVDALDSDRAQAVRAMRTQAVNLTSVAVESGDAELATAAAGLQYCLDDYAGEADFNKAKIAKGCRPLWAYLSEAVGVFAA